MAGCAASPDRHRLTRLTVGTVPYLTFAPIFIAYEEKYFAEQDLDIRFVKAVRSAEMLPALAAGQLDVLGGTIGSGFLNALARQASVKFVASKGYVAERGCVANALMARRSLLDSGVLKTREGLRGRRIASSRGSYSRYWVVTLLARMGVKATEVELMEVPDTALPAALANGTIELAAVSEPWITRITTEGSAATWVPAQEAIPNFHYGYVMYGPNLLSRDPDVGRRFMRAYLEGVKQYNQGKTARNIEIIAKYTDLPPSLVEASCWNPFSDDGRVDVRSVLQFQDWALAEGLVDTALTSDRFWDPRFIEAVEQSARLGLAGSKN
jgi:NitT/TauT family transport system substrate-binding protein